MDLRNLSFYLLVLVALFTNGSSKRTSLKSNAKTTIAKVDKIFDQLLPKIQSTIKENGMEPMPLRSFTERVVPLPGKLKGNISFRNGFLHYLSNLRRTKHVLAQYNQKRLLLDMTLGWSVLDFSYEYDFTYLLIQRRGDVYGRFEDADFNVILEVDFNKYEVILHRIQALRVEKFSLKLYGHKLDPLLNAIGQGVTRVFQNRIIKMIEEKSLLIFEPVVDSVNKWIKKPNRELQDLIASL